MIITSLSNPKVKNWLKLKEKKYRDLNNCFLIEGEHLLEEALKENLVMEIISLDEKYAISNIPFYLVNESIMKHLSSQVSSTHVIGVCRYKIPRELKGNVILLDDIQDPGNLGTIIRSSVAFNIDTIIMSPNCVDLYNEKVIRATEGMIFKVNFIKKDLFLMIKDLKKQGYKIWGTLVDYGTDLRTAKFETQNAVIIGNEGRGMNPELSNLVDENLNIKINKNCESLNAAIASALIMYEMSK